MTPKATFGLACPPFDLRCPFGLDLKSCVYVGVPHPIEEVTYFEDFQSELGSFKKPPFPNGDFFGVSWKGIPILGIVH